MDSDFEYWWTHYCINNVGNFNNGPIDAAKAAWIYQQKIIDRSEHQIKALESIYDKMNKQSFSLVEENKQLRKDIEGERIGRGNMNNNLRYAL